MYSVQEIRNKTKPPPSPQKQQQKNDICKLYGFKVHAHSHMISHKCYWKTWARNERVTKAKLCDKKIVEKLTVDSQSQFNIQLRVKNTYFTIWVLRYLKTKVTLKNRTFSISILELSILWDMYYGKQNINGHFFGENIQSQISFLTLNFSFYIFSYFLRNCFRTYCAHLNLS